MAVSRPGSYCGEVSEHRRTGYGLYVYPNSFFQYEGEWKQGKKHGHGKLLFKDGSYYEGEFTDGEIMGNGFRYWASTGNTYSGQFLFGELHGHGVLQSADGWKYEGEFSCGMQEGHGLLTDKDGQTYQGCFHKNRKHGGGKMIFKNGDEFEGDWILGQRQGHGVLHCASGTVYEGQWRNDTFNGQGSIIHCSGVIYDGLWLNGYPVGQAKKIVILGPEVIETMPGSTHAFQVQLQNEEGEVSESESGRLLEISAGIREGQVPAGLVGHSGRQQIKSSFGSEWISYPSMTATSGRPKPQTALPVVGKTGLILPELPISQSAMEPESTPKPPDGAGDALINQDEKENERSHFPHFQRVEHGSAVFGNVVLEPLLMDPQPATQSDEPPEKEDQKPSVRALVEKMTDSQEMVGDCRSEGAAEEWTRFRASQDPSKVTPAPPGEYVIMVREVTSPPFLGQHLPPAFKLWRVMPNRGKSTGVRKETKQDTVN
ncbi:MORN repeat-containing protein 1 [Rhineura floridana]|uniref:MORN repeat-containing protein 1 n=1 Tax=Rhineura floridana TaxID=261503 RepID=UPI002AC892FB|nr:MORN repeat-containing protein 1 [Rhineura floridana]